MELFEMSFFANFKYWVRVYDEQKQKSSIHNVCTQLWEAYEPAEDGEYTSVYKSKERFRKVEGNSSFARSRTQPVNPMDLVIRDDYRNRFNHKPRVMYLDIETHTGTVSVGFPNPSKALEPVSLIQFLDSRTGVIHLIGDKEFYFKDWYLSQKIFTDFGSPEVQYHKCNTEEEMFEIFFTFMEELCPAIVYAWNGSGFDFPYLYNRAKRLHLNTNRFSPFWKLLATQGNNDIVEARENTYGNFFMMDLSAAGIHYIDIKRLYQKIVLAPRPNYSLNTIATIELKVGKIDHSEFKTFEDFYQGNYVKPANPTPEQAATLCYQLSTEGADYEEIKKAGHGQFVFYGVIDVIHLKGIDEKAGLTGLMTKISERLDSNYHTVLGTTKSWGNYIRNKLYDQKVIIDETALPIDTEKSIQGGFVREPVTGKQQWVLSADVNSMYPILAIAGSNMSPETFRFCWDESISPELKDFAIKYLKVGTDQEQNEQNLLQVLENDKLSAVLITLLKQNNVAMAPNGTFYSKDRDGLIPSLVKEIYKERKAVKKEMFKKEQLLVEIDTEIKRRNLCP